MKVALAFTVYGDYYKHFEQPEEGFVIIERDNDYTEALKVLNEEVNTRMENGEFEFTYGDTPIKPILPIKKEDCGNIVPCNEDTQEPGYWDDVQFVFEIDENVQDFDIHKLCCVEYPFNFWEPRAVYVEE